MAAPSRLAALLVASALALGACGQSSKDSAKDFQGDQKAVAQAVEDLQHAGSKRDAGKICSDLLAPALVTQIRRASSQTCDDALKDTLADADAFELQVQKVTITGDRAVAVVKSEAPDSSRVDRLELVKVGDRWKLATLGANTAQ
jgi:Putative lumazine-binding